MRSIALILLATLPLTACGGGDSPKDLNSAGFSAITSEEWDAAEAEFKKALEALGDETADNQYLKARLGLIQTYANTDPDKALTEFADLKATLPDRVTDKEYSQVGGQLGKAGNMEQALALLADGQKAYPESPHMPKLVEKLGKMAERSGDSGALDKLKGLGYVGD